jgi:hypothetical protein
MRSLILILDYIYNGKGMINIIYEITDLKVKVYVCS